MGWVFAAPLEGSEFSGGTLTGPLLTLHGAAAWLFVLAAAVVAFRRRSGAAITLVAGGLSVPLYLYFTTPGLFRWLFPGDYAYTPPSWFMWDAWAVLGLVTVAAAAVLSVSGCRR